MRSSLWPQGPADHVTPEDMRLVLRDIPG